MVHRRRASDFPENRHQPKIFAKQKIRIDVLKSFWPLVTLQESHSVFVSPRPYHPPLEISHRQTPNGHWRACPFIGVDRK